MNSNPPSVVQPSSCVSKGYELGFNDRLIWFLDTYVNTFEYCAEILQKRGGRLRVTTQLYMKTLEIVMWEEEDEENFVWRKNRWLDNPPLRIKVIETDFNHVYRGIQSIGTSVTFQSSFNVLLNSFITTKNLSGKWGFLAGPNIAFLTLNLESA